MADDTDTEYAARIIRHEKDVLAAKDDARKDEEYVEQQPEIPHAPDTDEKDVLAAQGVVPQLDKLSEVSAADTAHDHQDMAIASTRPAPTQNQSIHHSFGLRDKIIRETIILGMICITVASLITGVAAPLAIVSAVVDRAFDAKEILHTIPGFSKFAKSKVGRALSVAKNIIFSRISRRIFKLAIPILAMAGVGAATGGLVPAIALTVSAINMVYNIAKDVFTLRKTRRLEEGLKNVNSINKAQETTELAVEKLRALGITVPPIVTAQDKVNHLEDEPPTSKTMTYMQSAVENVVEGAAALVETFTEGDFFKKVISILSVTAGTSKDTSERLNAADERAHLTDEIVKAGGDPNRSTKDLVREKEAMEKRMHGLLELASDDKLSVADKQAKVGEINEAFQNAISTPHPKQSIGVRIWNATKQLFRDVATVHNPHVFHAPETSVANVKTAHKVEQERHDVLRNNLRAPHRTTVMHDAVIMPATPSNARHSIAQQR